MVNLQYVFVFVFALGAWIYMKNPIDRIILTEKVAKEYDYVIVGGGSAGCVLASRLSEDKMTSVLLLEAGGSFGENPVFHIPSAWPLILKSQYDWDYYTTPQTHASQAMKGKQGYYPRGRILGGTSVMNLMHYTRGNPLDFDEWSSNGCDGWSYEDVLPYFLKSEDIRIPELKSSDYHKSGGPLTVSSGRISPMADLLLKAGREMGYNVTDYNSETQDGFSEIQLNVKDGVRVSTSLAYLGEINGRDNLDISINSFATKIDIESNRAVGVYFIKHGRKNYVRARKEIIVSAGTINSPQLLMLSGIGPKEHLSEMGIPAIAELPVGENLQDHSTVGLFTKVTEPLSITPDWRESWLSFMQYSIFGSGPHSVPGNEINAFFFAKDSLKGKTYPDFQFIFASFLITSDMFNIEDDLAKEYYPESAKMHGFSTFVVLTHPLSKGTVKLKSADPFDYPNIDPQLLVKQDDRDKLREGLRIWEHFLQTNAMRAVGADVEDMRMSACSHHQFRSDGYWGCFIQQFSTGFHHPVGTCKMGSYNDPSAVVDPELRVRGTRGLRVIDASVFPNITTGNTNAPVIMVAERAADLIRGKDTVEHLRRSIGL